MKREVHTKFYCFSQNNSGGKFKSPAKYVIIEALSADDANSRAENVDIYFDGVREERDCECCGDRWCAQWSDKDGTEEPSIYDMSLEDYIKDPGARTCLNKDIALILVKYMDGKEVIHK